MTALAYPYPATVAEVTAAVAEAITAVLVAAGGGHIVRAVAAAEVARARLDTMIATLARPAGVAAVIDAETATAVLVAHLSTIRGRGPTLGGGAW